MTIQTLIESGLFTVVNRGADTDRAITSVYCCDLLSVAMGHAPAGSAWVTVMGNINTLAVVALTDAACVVLAGGAHLDEAALAKSPPSSRSLCWPRMKPSLRRLSPFTKKLHD